MDESSAYDQPNRRHPVAGCVVVVLGGLVLLAFLVSGVARAIRNVRDGITAGEWATLGLIASCLAIVVVAVLVSALKERHRWARRLAQLGLFLRATVLTAYVGVLVLCLYGIVLLAAFASGVNQWVVDQAPVLQALVLVGLGAMAAAFLYRLLGRERRGEVITALVDARFGVLYALAFLLLAASVALTASSALLLVGADHRWWDLLGPDGGDTGVQVVDLDGLADEALTSKLVLWEMLDLVPIVELPRTLAWEEPPVTYEDWGVGLVLLAFKGVAGVALLAAGKALFDAWVSRDDRRARRAIDAAGGTGGPATPRYSAKQPGAGERLSVSRREDG